MKLHHEHVKDLAAAIVETRALCGDEQECIRDYLADHGFDRRGYSAPIVAEAAMRAADAQWRAIQRAVGVTNPISAAERRQINRDMEGN
jgi:hypothetical protein